MNCLSEIKGIVHQLIKFHHIFAALARTPMKVQMAKSKNKDLVHKTLAVPMMKVAIVFFFFS